MATATNLRSRRSAAQLHALAGVEREIRGLQSLALRHDGWAPPIVKTVASVGTGVEELAKAIAGWNEALDAKAFQLEQSATQATTAGLVVINGVIIGTVVIGIFSVLIAIINNGLLW